MKIEILNGQDVLEVYDGVTDPPTECVDYIFAEVEGRTGIAPTGWRQWTKALPEKRRDKIEATKNEARRRIALVDPALNYEWLADLLRLLWPALLDPAGVPTLNAAKDIAVYAKTKIDELKIADEATVDSYDPVTDQNWPT